MPKALRPPCLPVSTLSGPPRHRRGWLQGCPVPFLTTGSFTMSSRLMILGPPRRFSRILISRLIFFFFTGWQRESRLRSEPSPAVHTAASGRLPRALRLCPPEDSSSPPQEEPRVLLLGGTLGEFFP